MLAIVAAALMSAWLPPFSSSKSPNACLDCHQNYNMYLDILEGNAGNTLPTVLKDGEALTVAVVLKVTSNSPNYKTISTITATLASQNGLFSVSPSTCSIGSLSKGQTATARWKISPLASGTDFLSISARGVNQHGPTYFSDSYSPQPSITVEKLATDIAPSIEFVAPAPGLRFSGGTDIPISWIVNDDNRSTCLVSLYYTTDNFNTMNVTVATGIPAGEIYTWKAPNIDSNSVGLKVTVVDRNGNFNETRTEGDFAIDSTGPSVISVAPADKANDVTDSAILQVRFSEPVAEGVAQGAFRISPDPGGVVWGWNADKTTMTATHNAFRAKTTYLCTLASGVRDLSSPGNVNAGSFSWSFSTPEVLIPKPSIVLESPAGGERFHWNDNATIHWTASGGTGTLTINLSISENGTGGPFIPVASGISNTGQHAFTIPRFLSDGCVVEAAAHDEAGMEARSRGGAFSIAQNLSVEATFPPAGIPLRAGNPAAVGWTATGGHGAVIVNLSFLQDANSTARAVLSDLPRSGRSEWTLPEVNTDSARLILKATDDWGRSFQIISGRLTIFTENPPPMNTNRPPVVLFNIREPRVTTGYPATFDASGSFDPDGDSLRYIWDFGDGTDIANTTNPTMAHVFPDGGNYTVALTVGDARNETRQAMVVHVGAPPVTQNTGFEEWTIVMSGILVISMGMAGVGCSLAKRPATKTVPGGGNRCKR